MRACVSIWALGLATMKGGLRDRLIQGLLLTGVLFFLSTVAFSSFSMRQPSEVAINYSLSITHVVAVLITLFLGLHLLSREIENRAGHTVLTQPVSRTVYIAGKFWGLCLLAGIIVLFLSACALAGIFIVRTTAPNALPFVWFNFGVAVGGIFLVCLLLLAATLLLCTVATSSIFPFLATLALWVIGNSTQTIMNYMQTNGADPHMTPLLRYILQGVYYLFPNLTLLDFKVYAIYGLPIALSQIAFALAYGVVYTALLISLAIWLFRKRDMV